MRPASPGGLSAASSWAASAAASDATGFAAAGGSTSQEVLPERVLVTLKTAGHEGKRGVVVEVNSDGTYEVMLSDEVKKVSATRGDLEVVRPAKRDRVIILRGDNKGSVGQLIGIDNEDGIVKMGGPGGESDIKIIDLDSCAATE